MSAVMEEKPLRGLREAAVLAFIASALFFLLSLLTFSNEDPGWTHSGTTQTVANACGVFGAWLADFSLSFFGLAAYLFPPVMLWQCYLLYGSSRIRSSGSAIALRWLGIAATVVAGTALSSLYLLRIRIELPGSTGGILGQEISNSLLVKLGNSGATLFLLAIFLSGISLATRLSWGILFSQVGKSTLALCRHLFARAQPAGAMRPAVFKPPQAAGDAGPRRRESKKPAIVKTPAAAAAVTQAPFFDKDPEEAPEKPVKTGRKTGVKPAFQSGPDILPALALLDERDCHVRGYTQADLEDMSRLVENILQDFNVVVEVVGVVPGPVITRFELLPAAGVKVSRISTLSKDLARALSVTSVRIVEVIPGKSVIGLEIPNRERETVTLRELLSSAAFEKSKASLTLAMGKDSAGSPLMADLAKMPHALVAGTTGSGKSVAINTMILSLLYKSAPQQVRLIMIDPKMLELSVYEGIPHLLTPVVTDMKEAHNALRWAVGEMERRYKLMSKMGVRNLAGFNQLLADAEARGETVRDPMHQPLAPLDDGEEWPVLSRLPSIVIVIDELADMMMIVGKKVEELIARLAQKARAAGIHLILATQRPSVDVLTGLIKANVPTRISFQVSSRIDSRTILDQGGAEALLGNGDMLFLPSGTSIPIRAHGAFVDDREVHRIVEFLRQTAPPDYLEEITQEASDGADGFSLGGNGGGEREAESDSLYDEAVQFVTQSRKASISSVQRRFRVGYNRAATLIEDMEAAGIVSPPETNGSRVVLAPPPVKD